MAVTVADAAVALRIIGAPDAAVDPAVSAILTRQIAVATALVESHAGMAPVDVQDEAVIRIVGFLFDQDPAMPRSMNVMVQSGAGSVLAPWHMQRLLGPSVEAAAAAAGITGAQVVALLTALAGEARLPASAVRDLPEEAGGVADGAVTLDKLATDTREVLDGAVQVDGISLTGDDLVFASDGGDTTTIDLEGLGGGGGGGLTQSQVDARIDHAIPAARRVPGYAVGDADEVLKVAKDGNSIRWAPDEGLAQGEVDARVQAGVATWAQEGNLGFIPANKIADAQDVLRSSDPLPSSALVTLGNIANLRGRLYEVVSSDDSHVYRGRIGDAHRLSGDHPELRNLRGDATFNWSDDPPGNIVFLWDKTIADRLLGMDSVAGDRLPASIYIVVVVGAAHLYADTVLARASGSDTSSAYAYHRSAGEAAIEYDFGDSYDTDWDFEVQFYTDAARTRRLDVQRTTRWVPDDRNIPHVAKAALLGDTDRWSKSKLPSDTVYTGNLPPRVGITQFDETFPGLTLTRTDTDNRPAAPSYFDPTFDLDDTDKAHGEFHCSLHITLGGATDVNMGFRQGGANQTAADRERVLSNIVFASDLAEEGDFVFSSTAALEGLPTFSVPVYSGSTLVGTYILLLVHNSANQAGVYYHWDGQAGATGATLTVELRIAFTPSDFTAGTGGGGGLTQAQVDARVQHGVADWAESNNAAAIPSLKLASGGAVGNVLTRTAQGQAWQAAAAGGGLTIANRGTATVYVNNFGWYTSQPATSQNRLLDGATIPGITGIPSTGLVCVIMNYQASSDQIVVFPVDAFNASNEQINLLWERSSQYIGFAARRNSNGTLRLVGRQGDNFIGNSHPNSAPFKITVWSIT